MGEQVTVTLPDSVVARAAAWAQRSGRTMEQVLADTLEQSLLPLGSPQPEWIHWTDREVLAAADCCLPLDDDQRMSELLDEQQRGGLARDQSNELDRLMRVYQEGLLLKAEALREAVRRGLRAPVAP